MAEATAAVATKVYLRRTSGDNINPATEDKQDQIITALGAIPTNPASTIWERQTALSVPSSILTTVLSYTVVGSAGSITVLDAVRVTGTAAAEFRIELNGVHKETARTEVTDPSPLVPLHNYRTIPGDIVRVSVIHSQASTLHDFEATLHAHK